jgi:hypothetical protein
MTLEDTTGQKCPVRTALVVVKTDETLKYPTECSKPMLAYWL